MMKRLIGLLAILVAVLAAGVGPARALPPGGPALETVRHAKGVIDDTIAQTQGDRDTALACADIRDGFPEMTADAETGLLSVSFREYLFDKPCPGVEYRFTVTNPDTGAVLADVRPTSGDGSDDSPLLYSTEVLDANAAHTGTNEAAEVCVYADTVLAGQVLDRAPDAGCVTVSIGSSPGTRFR